MAAEALLEELRGAPYRSVLELVDATGLSPNAIECRVRRANRSGFHIVNLEGGPSGHRPAVYALKHEPGYCHVSGCRIRLSPSNHTGYCRAHLPTVAFGILVERLEHGHEWGLDKILDEFLYEELEIGVTA